MRAAVSAFGQPAQLHRVRLPSLVRRADLLVRQRLASEVLRVKRAKGGPDCRADPYDAFFHVWPKKHNPQRHVGAAYDRFDSSASTKRVNWWGWM